MNYLALEDCKKGKVYQIRSRNLDIAVFDGDSGFIGIRTEINDSGSLFTEYYHNEANGHVGTVRPIKEIGEVPDWIPLVTGFSGVCRNCGRNIINIPYPNPTKPKQIWYRFEHIFESETLSPCPKASPCCIQNRFLFDELSRFEV